MRSNDFAPLRPDFAPGEVLAPRPDFAPLLQGGARSTGRGQARSKQHVFAPLSSGGPEGAAA
jgi:hypothetical protein